MAEPKPIASVKNPRVKAVQHLRRRRERQRRGLFIAEGRREISRALDAAVHPVELYSCPEMDADIEPWLKKLGRAASDTERFTVLPAVMNAMAYRENPEGVLAVMRTPARTLDDLSDPIRSPDVGELWLVGVGIEKPGNLGAMARCAEATGCCGVLVADGDADPYNPNCIRASTGAIFDLPVVTDTSDALLHYLRARGVRLVVTVPGADTPYTDADMTGRTAVVVGAEDRGVPHDWVAQAQKMAGWRSLHTVGIPMVGGGVDSLNTSVAAAVVLYEALRQRLPGRT